MNRHLASRTGCLILTFASCCALTSSVCQGQQQAGIPTVRPPSRAPKLEAAPSQQADATPTQPPARAGGDSEDDPVLEFGPNVSLGLAVLIFGGLTVVLFSWMVSRGVKFDDYTFKLLGLPLILTTALFLIPGGYTAHQVAPLMGLLGTLTGYLLGSGSGRVVSEQK